MGLTLLGAILMIPVAYASSLQNTIALAIHSEETVSMITIADNPRVTSLGYSEIQPIATRIIIWATTAAVYDSQYYVSVKGTFTANYSTHCVAPNWCSHPSEPDAPALPIGLILRLTVTDGTRAIQTFNIVTNGMEWWSTEFWLPKAPTSYHLSVTFNGYAEFQPTSTETLLQVAG